MKNYLMFFLVCTTSLITGCTNKCSDAKVPETPSLFVTFINEASNENVFGNESFTENQITIVDLEENEVPFSFLIDKNVIHITPEHKNKTNGTIIITLNNPETMVEKIIQIQFDILKGEKECYTLHTITNVVVLNKESSFENSIYTIKI